MKANEAPEKLYLFEGEPILVARSEKKPDANIEYTRTDAFIKKALEYLSKHQCEYIDFDDFCKALKGEKV